MDKSIETHLNEMQQLFKENVQEFSKKMVQCSEEIVLAFIAKYALQPDEVRLCYQGNKFWVDKREDINPTPEFLHYKDIANKYQQLVDYLTIVLSDMPADKVCDPVFMGIERKLINLGAIEENHD